MLLSLLISITIAQVCTERNISIKFSPKAQNEGNNAKVRRIIGNDKLKSLDPFLLMDHFFVDPPAGFPDHPHRGFETITYMLRGVCVHEDFSNNRGELHPGDIQWMTAGRGIVHAEMPKTSMEGIQIWLNLKSSQKLIPPHYQEFRASKFPVYDSPDINVKVLSGCYFDKCSPIIANTKAQL